jgi:CheY-like chemotaxis protein
MEQLMNNNNNEYSILLVDQDEAFATMLRESLEQNNEYRATVTTSGDEALQALTTTQFDLAIVDLGLAHPDGAAVARMLQQRQASLRLMLIPLVGDELPSELADLDVHGVLPKPFFLPELPNRITDAMARHADGGPGTAGTPSVAATVKPDMASDQSPVLHQRIPKARIPRIIQVMTTLAQEVNAEAVILSCKDGLIAHTGRLSDEEADGLARAVCESWQTSARVAQILGRKQLGFEQSVEGGEHMFYSLGIAEDIILSAALRVSVRLGIIRHRTKATAERLRALVSTTP